MGTRLDEPYPIRVKAADVLGEPWTLELVQPAGQCRLYHHDVLIGSAHWYGGMLHDTKAKADRHYQTQPPWKTLEDAMRKKIDRLRSQAEAAE